MQPIKYLMQWLSNNANEKYYLFTFRDLRALYNDLSDAAFKTLLSRAVQSCLLTQVCRGIYLYQNAPPQMAYSYFTLQHCLELMSLKTALSDAGVISQIPINWISIISSGRSNTISCGKFGSIEFVHTNQKPADLTLHLTYDHLYRMWRANVALALRDMKATHRDCGVHATSKPVIQ